MSALVSRIVSKARCASGGLKVEFADGSGRQLRRRNRAGGRGPLRRPRRALGAAARSRTQARRALHGRPPRGDAGRSLRSARRRLGQPVEKRRLGLGQGAREAARRGCMFWTQRNDRGARPQERRSRITISTTGSTISSSTPTGNIPAPISSIPARRSRRRNSPRSAISPPSCWSTSAIACSTSAAASAAWGFISRGRPARASSASRCPRSSTRSRSARAAEAGLDAARRFPPAGLSRRRGAVRPHRLGRHVRTCRRWPASTNISATSTAC